MLWAIKPRLWPRIEFFSSGGQEFWHLFMGQQQAFTFRISYKIQKSYAYSVVTYDI